MCDLFAPSHERILIVYSPGVFGVVPVNVVIYASPPGCPLLPRFALLLAV